MFLLLPVQKNICSPICIIRVALVIEFVMFCFCARLCMSSILPSSKHCGAWARYRFWCVINSVPLFWVKASKQGVADTALPYLVAVLIASSMIVFGIMGRTAS